MNRRWLFLISISFLGSCFQAVHSASADPTSLLKTGLDDLEANLRLVKNLHFKTSPSVSLIVPVVNKRVRIDLGELGAGCIFDPFPEKTQLRLATIGKGGTEDTSTHEVMAAFKNLFADKINFAARGFKDADIEEQHNGTEQKTMMQKIIAHLDNIWVSPNMIYSLKQAMLHKDMMTGDYFARGETNAARALRYSGDQFIMMMRLLQSWDRDFKLDAAIKGIVDKFPKDVRQFLEMLSKQIAGDAQYLANKINAMWDIWSGAYHFTFGPDGLPTNFGVHASAVHFGEDTAGCDMWWKLLDKGEHNPESWSRLEKQYPRHSFLELLPMFTAKTGDEEKDAVRAQRAAALSKASYEDGGRYHAGQKRAAPAFITKLEAGQVPSEDRCPTLRRSGNTIIAFMKRPTLHDSMRLVVGIVALFMRDYLRIVAGNNDDARAYREAVQTSRDAVNHEAYYFGTSEGRPIYAGTVGLVSRDPLRGAPDESGSTPAQKQDAEFARKKALVRSRRVGIKVAATKKAILEELISRVDDFDVDRDDHRSDAWETNIKETEALAGIGYPARAVAPPPLGAPVVGGVPVAGARAAAPRPSAPPLSSAAINPVLAPLESDKSARGKLSIVDPKKIIATSNTEAIYVKSPLGHLYRKYKETWQKETGSIWELVNAADVIRELEAIVSGVRS